MQKGVVVAEASLHGCLKGISRKNAVSFTEKCALIFGNSKEGSGVEEIVGPP